MSSPSVELGVEWIVDAGGCDPGALRSVDRVAELFETVIRELDLHPVAPPAFHPFPHPGGITGFVVLSESHLACHTYPEFGTATVNLYCCRERPEWDWRGALARAFGATAVDVTVVRRRALVTLAESAAR